MLDEDIVRIRGRSPQARYLMRDGALTTEASHDMSRLLAEVERLMARERQADGLLERVQDGEMALAEENAALREIVRALAEMPTPDAKRDDGLLLQGRCPWCKGTGEWLGSKLRHTPDCPVTKARALLAADSHPKVQPDL